MQPEQHGNSPRFAELAESGQDAAPAGSLLEMLIKAGPRQKTVGRRRPTATQESMQQQPSGTYRGAQPPKRHFLTEFEICGDVAQAARIAGCTAWEVHQWRAADRMFSRDFALAAVAHVKALKQMVQEVHRAHDSLAVRAEAQQLLRSEAEFIGFDGRLDVRARGDALKAFLDRVGFDRTEWEPGDYPD